MCIAVVLVGYSVTAEPFLYETEYRTYDFRMCSNHFVRRHSLKYIANDSKLLKNGGFSPSVILVIFRNVARAAAGRLSWSGGMTILRSRATEGSGHHQLSLDHRVRIY